MGDTLVLETSAFAHESSTLSIPTKNLGDVAEWFKAPHCYRGAPRKGAIRSNRIVSASIACSSRSLFARDGFLQRSKFGCR